MKTKIDLEAKKMKALEKWWVEQGNDIEDLNGCYFDGDEIEIGKQTYLVLTDEEADQKAKDYILETVWSFNKSFLDGHSEAIAEMDEKVFSKIQEMCESANKTILRLIDDVDHFVEDAIAADGRGHFLSSYDGGENEQSVDGEYFFIYRTN